MWRQEDEIAYKSSLASAKRNNRDKFKSATLADCALASFIYTYINTETIEQQRGELLDRLLEGHQLTPSELRFLTYSSKYMACFLDHHVYQQAVVLTKNKIIEDVVSNPLDRVDDC